MFDAKEIGKILIEGNQEKLIGLVKNLLEEGVEAGVILDRGLIPGMDVIGEKMESEEMFIPEVLRAAKIMAACVEILKPHLSGEGTRTRGKVVIGTVKGDLHDIGKNLVSMMLESTGLEVYNLGVDVTPEAFVKAIKEKDAGILALSALLTTTMPMMKKTVQSVKESGLRGRVKILVGGAPVTPKFAEEIGADGYAPDAGSAARLIKSMV